MQQLKKWGAIGGAVSLVLCWPLAVGSIGQNVINDGVAHLNSDAFKADVVDYDRGYLSSTVKTRFQVIDPHFAEQLRKDGLPTEFFVLSDVSHGLMSLSAHSVLENSTELPIELDTTTQLNGNTDFNLQLDNWHYVAQNKQKVMVSLSPASLSGSLTVLGELSYLLDMPSVELDFASGNKLMMTGIKANGQGKRTSSFWIGEQQLSIADASVIDTNQNSTFHMQNASYHFTSNEDATEQRVSGQHVMTLENLTTAKGEVGQFKMDLSFGDLDSQAFSRLLDIYQNNPTLSNSQIQAAVNNIETLFAQGFYVSMNQLSANVGEGNFHSSFDLKVPQGTKNVAKNPMSVLPVLTGQLDSYVSETLLQSFPNVKQLVDEAIVMDIAEQTNQGYRIQAQLENSNLVFKNGQKIPLMALLLPMFISR